MDQLLYYPGFEIMDERWLKFALLYLEDVHTIVPHEADYHLSESYSLLSNNTNLLVKYRPTYDEAAKSSNETIDLLVKYLRNPERNFGILGTINVEKYWSNPHNQDYELFSGKISHYFSQFCLDQNFGHLTSNGIRIPGQLALIYMTILAHNISEHNNLPVITDVKQYNGLSALNSATWKKNKFMSEVKAVMKLIELELPKNIDDIHINDIIRLRNKNGYIEKLRAFRSAVSDLNRLKNGNLDEWDYSEIIDHINESKQSLVNEIIELSKSVSVMLLGVTICMSNPSSSNLELIKELFEVGTLVTGTIGIKNIIKENNKPKLANKYLTEIRSMNFFENSLTKISRRK